MHPISEELTFNVTAESDYIEFLIEPPTLAVNICFKIACDFAIFNQPFNLTFIITDGLKSTTLIEQFHKPPSHSKYLISGESDETETIVGNMVKVSYSELLSGVSNTGISISIQACFISAEERESYRQSVISSLRGGG